MWIAIQGCAVGNGSAVMSKDPISSREANQIPQPLCHERGGGSRQVGEEIRTKLMRNRNGEPKAPASQDLSADVPFAAGILAC